ncbi:mCG146843 [Mus musculus]|nr:mCG146843 [Mus musculus]
MILSSQEGGSKETWQFSVTSHLIEARHGSKHP